ncbi:MAG: HU family DNA-binding protein [Desulfomonile tiedjei]|nr:HU family DNA-binding protein [Desulfomonile tiedjei]
MSWSTIGPETADLDFRLVSLADDPSFMKGEATETVYHLLEPIESGLIAGEDVMIAGFEKWPVKGKRARRGRNPQTRKPIVLDARRMVTWQYSPVLKKAVNELDFPY